MRRLILGLAIGAGLAYYLDPTRGTERRRRLTGFLTNNREQIHEVARTTAQVASSVGQGAQQVAEKVGEKVTRATDRGNGTADPVNAGMGGSLAAE